MSKIPPNQHIPDRLNLSDQILTKAAQEFGTPLYVYDAVEMKQKWHQLRSIFPDNVVVFYSVKANPNIQIINTFRRLGASCEVASFGELTTALQAGVSPTNIIFVGPGKSKQELENAIAYGIQAIIAESQREVKDIQILSHRQSKKTPIALRINPGRGKGIITMGGTTQFGMEPEEALKVLVEMDNYPNLKIIGLHAYLGTGILNWKVILEHTQMILQVANTLQQQSGCELNFIDIGGGFGIPYYEKDTPLDLETLRPSLSELIDDYLQRHPQTIFAIESGRFLVGSSGIFATRVIDVKKSGDKWFVILDGGTNVFGGDNRYRGFRPTPVKVLNSRNVNNKLKPITLCGPLCTSADQLAVDTLLPLPEIGDLLAFYQAGAYGLTASPGLFLSHGFPSEVLFREGQLSLIRERL